MEVAILKIFVASLYSSFIQCPTSNRDATLKDVKDDKTFLLTSDLCFRDDFFQSLPLGHLLMLYTTILVSSLPYTCRLDSGNSFLSHPTPPRTIN